MGEKELDVGDSQERRNYLNTPMSLGEGSVLTYVEVSGECHSASSYLMFVLGT